MMMWRGWQGQRGGCLGWVVARRAQPPRQRLNPQELPGASDYRWWPRATTGARGPAVSRAVGGGEDAEALAASQLPHVSRCPALQYIYIQGPRHQGHCIDMGSFLRSLWQPRARGVQQHHSAAGWRGRSRCGWGGQGSCRCVVGHGVNGMPVLWSCCAVLCCAGSDVQPSVARWGFCCSVGAVPTATGAHQIGEASAHWAVAVGTWQAYGTWCSSSSPANKQYIAFKMQGLPFPPPTSHRLPALSVLRLSLVCD